MVGILLAFTFLLASQLSAEEAEKGLEGVPPSLALSLPPTGNTLTLPQLGPDDLEDLRTRRIECVGQGFHGPSRQTF